MKGLKELCEPQTPGEVLEGLRSLQDLFENELGALPSEVNTLVASMKIMESLVKEEP